MSIGRSAEQAAEEGEDLFEFAIGGKVEKLSRAEVERRLHFDASNTQRAQELAEERRQDQVELAAERQRIAEREARLSATLDTLVNRATPDKQAEPPPKSLREIIRPHLEALPTDYVSDAEAGTKVQRAMEGMAEGLEQAWGDRDATLSQKYEARIAALQTEMAAKVAEAGQQAEVKLTRHSAATDAESRNERVFEEALATSELANLPLTNAEIAEIRRKAENTYNDQTGKFDPVAQKWIYTTRAVIDAARLVDSVYEKLRAKDHATVRSEGLRARLRGEDASRSTPSRSRPAFGSENNDDGAGFLDKISLLEARLKENPHAAADIMAQLSPQEIARFKQLRAERAALLRSG